MKTPLTILLSYKSRSAGDSAPYTTLLPVGLGYLNSALAGAGYSARLANFSSFTWSRIEAFLRDERPTLLAISQFTHNRSDSVKLARLAKKLDPGCLVIFGGPHATPCYRELLLDHPAIDMVVIGEGEETLVQVAQVVESGRLSDISNVAGLALRRDGEVILTEPRAPIADLDALPWPVCSIRDSVGVDPYRQLEFIVTSRGCPSACSFCGSPRFWGRGLRFRSPRSVVDEIKYIRDSYGLMYFSIRDDTFTADRQRTIEICRLLIQEKIHILWNCQSRVSAVDSEMLDWMKRAGCECLQFGVESGSPTILRALGKRITNEEVSRAAAATRAAGIQLSIYLITGVDGETDDDVNQTLRLIDRIRPMDGQVSPLAYYPGTPLYLHAVKEGKVSQDLFRTSPDEAFYVRGDGFVERAKKQLLTRVAKVGEQSGYTEGDFREQRKRLGYCHATNLMAGEWHEAMGNTVKAEVTYREITEREPDNPWGWLTLGELLAGEGRLEDARVAFLRLVALVPKHLPGYEALAELADLLGDLKGARKYRREAESLRLPGIGVSG